MALINCPNCDKKISTSVNKCIHCGVDFELCPECNTICMTATQSTCPTCGYKFKEVEVSDTVDQIDDIEDTATEAAPKEEKKDIIRVTEEAISKSRACLALRIIFIIGNVIFWSFYGIYSTVGMIVNVLQPIASNPDPLVFLTLTTALVMNMILFPRFYALFFELPIEILRRFAISARIKKDSFDPAQSSRILRGRYYILPASDTKENKKRSYVWFSLFNVYHKSGKILDIVGCVVTSLTSIALIYSIRNMIQSSIPFLYNLESIVENGVGASYINAMTAPTIIFNIFLAIHISASCVFKKLLDDRKNAVLNRLSTDI